MSKAYFTGDLIGPLVTRHALLEKMIACPVKWDPACRDISRGIELRIIEFD